MTNQPEKPSVIVCTTQPVGIVESVPVEGGCHLCHIPIVLSKANVGKVKELGLLPICLRCAIEHGMLADKAKVSGLIQGQKLNIEESLAVVEELIKGSGKETDS